MLRTGQFTTKCKGNRDMALKQHHFGRTPTRTLNPVKVVSYCNCSCDTE